MKRLALVAMATLTFGAPALAQPIPPTDEGCGKDLDAWFKKSTAEPKPTGARAPILMSALPPACKMVLNAK